MINKSGTEQNSHPLSPRPSFSVISTEGESDDVEWYDPELSHCATTGAPISSPRSLLFSPLKPPAECEFLFLGTASVHAQEKLLKMYEDRIATLEKELVVLKLKQSSLVTGRKPQGWASTLESVTALLRDIIEVGVLCENEMFASILN